MKRNILLLSMVSMFGLMLFTNVDQILWLYNGSTQKYNWTEGLFPLLINNLIWLSLIPLFLIWKSKKDFSTITYIILILTVIIQLATTIYAQITSDPLAAGLPFVIVTIPISIILLILAIKDLKSN